MSKITPRRIAKPYRQFSQNLGTAKNEHQIPSPETFTRSQAPSAWTTAGSNLSSDLHHLFPTEASTEELAPEHEVPAGWFTSGSNPSSDLHHLFTSEVSTEELAQEHQVPTAWILR